MYLLNQVITIASYNCNGLVTANRASEFKHAIAHRRLDFICLTEAGLNTSTNMQIQTARWQIAPRNYSVIHRLRQANAFNHYGGGTVVLFRNAIQVAMEPFGYQRTFDLLEFTVTSNGGRQTLISVVYVTRVLDECFSDRFQCLSK